MLFFFFILFFRGGAECGVGDNDDAQKNDCSNDVKSFQRSNYDVHFLPPFFNIEMLTSQDNPINAKPEKIGGNFISFVSVRIGSIIAPKNNNPRFPVISEILSSWDLLNFSTKFMVAS